MSKFLQEFKNFAIKGNVVDMAVGIIIGGAFGKIVTSLVSDIIMPAVGLLAGGLNFTDWKWVLRQAVLDPATQAVLKPELVISYGKFLQVTLDFLIIAFSIFLVIKALNKAKDLGKKEDKVAAAEKAASEAKAVEEAKAAEEAKQAELEKEKAALKKAQLQNTELLKEIRDLLKVQQSK